MTAVSLIAVNESTCFEEFWPRAACRITQPDILQIAIQIVSEVIDPSMSRSTDGAMPTMKVRVHSIQPSIGYRPKLQNINRDELHNMVDTVSIDAVERLCPKVLDLQRRLARRLAVPFNRVSSTLFVSPKGSGVRWHFDAAEVFVISLSGNRTWKMSQNADVRFPMNYFSPDVSGSVHPDLQRIMNGPISNPDEQYCETVSPGSVLFLPRGFWHSTYSETDSISLSISVATPTPIEVLCEAVRRSLLPHSEWRNPENTSRLSSPRAFELTTQLLSLLSTEDEPT